MDCCRLAEQAERYDDMVNEMRQVVEMNPNLSVEERNLLSVAYKNVIGSHRAAFRVVQSIYDKARVFRVSESKLFLVSSHTVQKGRWGWRAQRRKGLSLSHVAHLQLYPFTHRCTFFASSSQEKATGSDGSKLDIVNDYMAKIVSELETICAEILTLIKKNLINSQSDHEGLVFYHKMAGDYNRYLAEIRDTETRRTSSCVKR